MNIRKSRSKKVVVIVLVVLICLTGILFCTGTLPINRNRGKVKETEYYPQAEQDTGRQGEIFLYGEAHSKERILEKEFELWGEYYADGMRHLFVELPYFMAEYLNEWMQSDNDDILEELYKDWEGTAGHSPQAKAFYVDIKKSYPETVFHGIDVGHRYDITGERYLKHLKAEGMEHSEQYSLTLDAIEQGKYYYKHSDDVYRENMMVQNFIREFEKLGGMDVMGIFGAAHTDLDAMDDTTSTVPCMANQLKERYGKNVHAEDLITLILLTEPLKTETVKVDGREYEASYFGKEDISMYFPEYQYREFWRLENAYDDFKNRAVTGNVLPYNLFPMVMEEKQVYIIDYTKTDGSVKWEYHRSDGKLWEGREVTEEFTID